MREEIADALARAHNVRKAGIGFKRDADAIIAALPGMVEPLVWENFDRFMTQSGSYTIRKAPFETYWRLFFGGEFIGHDLDKDILGVKANAHHVAQVMKAFGVVV